MVGEDAGPADEGGEEEEAGGGGGEVQRRRIRGEDDRGVREHAEEGGDADGEAGEGVERELGSACQEEERADARAYALRYSRSRAPI